MNKLKFHLKKITSLIYLSILSILRPWQKIEGIWMPIKLSIGYNTLRWILNGEYEQGEINIIKKRLSRNDTVFEIGTGLGFVSSYCSKLIGSQKIFTYEANVMNIPVCEAVFLKNKVNPIVKNAILADKSGSFDFPINKKNRLGSSILINTMEYVTIPMLDLNMEIERISPTFLIMDIEGAEFEIFSIINFQTIRKVQFELHPLLISKEKCDAIFNVLNINGFVKDAEISVGQNYFYER